MIDNKCFYQYVLPFQSLFFLAKTFSKILVWGKNCSWTHGWDTFEIKKSLPAIK